MSDEHGQIPTDDEIEAMQGIYGVLTLARMKPFTTKSALARQAANEIALCASEGLLTTRLTDSTFGNVWMVTSLGLDYMEGLDDVFPSD